LGERVNNLITTTGRTQVRPFGFSDNDLRELIQHIVKKSRDCPYMCPCRIKDLAKLPPAILKQLLDRTS
jgi:hypothetical protein